ncbi:FMN-binding negative transcriptional regulator [Alicyclobacillus sp. ALC3]|uniref:FMN-binding negative transcriptional regulator n=1 Tax=Alicyclobacillus sp. ALC3 TaxID=2796143 RepID=UPI0023786BC3|nr:FMN-binding negative transcriptional regulator [Alicyclobacillus sp. ALC3]WDL96429.1 FMN-binding negative transcriptional regulator [Alicyclobacillus sp. ALC3]
MYIPKSFAMSEARMKEFIEIHSFGLLMSQHEGQQCGTHLPFLFDNDGGALYGHVAKANPQWQDIDGQDVMAVFSGAHSYISPSWYGIGESVPTWNYVAVHVYGTCHVMNDVEELAAVLERMVRFYDPDSPVSSESGEPYFRRMTQAIVGFRIDIARMEGAAKLSQNKPAEVRERVIDQLQQADDSDAQTIARWMTQDWNK